MTLTSRGLVRLFLFIGGYVLFLLFGALVFSAIEDPEEREKVKNLRNLRTAFLKHHSCISGKLMKQSCFDLLSISFLYLPV